MKITEPKESDIVSIQHEGAGGSQPATPAQPKINLDPDQARQLLEFARATVAHAIRHGETAEIPASGLPREIADAPAFGVFVTLTRSGALRACRGYWGKVGRLEEVVGSAARDSATLDPRFPGIVLEEVPLLELDVSLLHRPRVLDRSAADWPKQIVVGRDGLVLNHPKGRGLLLPQVASERGWDVPTFLKHLSMKAGLPEEAWRDPETKLLAFSARVYRDPPRYQECDVASLGKEAMEHLGEIARAILVGCAPPSLALRPELTETAPVRRGILLNLSTGGREAYFGINESLAQMTAQAAQRVLARARKHQRHPGELASIITLFRPLALRAGEDPSRHRGLAQSAILAQGGESYALSIPAPDRGRNVVEHTLKAAGKSLEEWRAKPNETSVTAFSVFGYRPAARTERRPVRAPARAGQFYPADEATMLQRIDHFLSQGEPDNEASCRAVMLPHAGWSFCGSIIGKTLARTRVPKTAIVLSPKHTPLGSRWSISAADAWEFPGRRVPVATDLRDRLVARCAAIDIEDEAHRLEHGIEVLVPFLAKKQPELRILPLVVGQASFEETATLAEALVEVLGEVDDQPLLVISSDMNHFATEEENRRLDHLAIDAMVTGDARTLHDTVRGHSISMCGVLPAVTVLQVLERRAGEKSAPELVDYTNSGQVAGDNARVVGYAGVVIA
ncbi:AmmeMemoRadiSam system protein B [Kolteria novifilia]|uniref:AmmeMemoRadiSam system protein B n=1 Tax=Kolteria novifilia TaxID=2527975 RepID=UPI003AF3F710